MSQKKHIAFLGNNCQWSTAFYEELKKTPWVHEFEIIVVNPKNGPRPKLPAWLKQTPTLVIAGEKTPRLDGEVMNWLSEKRMMGQAQRTNQVMDPAMDNEPMAWSRSELGVGLSGGGGVSYSLIDSDTSAETGTAGLTMPGTFSFINGQAAQATQASDNFPGGGGRGGKKTKKEEMFDQQMDEYMKSRDFGMPKGPARI